jgi:hypothetical protein
MKLHLRRADSNRQKEEFQVLPRFKVRTQKGVGGAFRVGGAFSSQIEEPSISPPFRCPQAPDAGGRVPRLGMAHLPSWNWGEGRGLFSDVLFSEGISFRWKRS